MTSSGGVVCAVALLQGGQWFDRIGINSNSFFKEFSRKQVKDWSLWVKWKKFKLPLSEGRREKEEEERRKSVNDEEQDDGGEKLEDLWSAVVLSNNGGAVGGQTAEKHFIDGTVYCLPPPPHTSEEKEISTQGRGLRKYTVLQSCVFPEYTHQMYKQTQWEEEEKRSLGSWFEKNEINEKVE